MAAIVLLAIAGLLTVAGSYVVFGLGGALYAGAVVSALAGLDLARPDRSPMPVAVPAPPPEA